MKKLLTLIIIVSQLSIPTVSASAQTETLASRLEFLETRFTQQTTRLKNIVEIKCNIETEGSSSLCERAGKQLTIITKAYNRNTKLLSTRLERLQKKENSTLEEMRTNILLYTNKEREKVGLPPLSYNKTLEIAAQAHSEDLAKRNYFDHDTPEGKTPSQRIEEAGYLIGTKDCNCTASWATGENIAYVEGIEPTAKYMVELWMDSYGHQLNVIRNDYEEIGIGFFENRATQNFGRTSFGQYTAPTPTKTYTENQEKETRDYGNLTEQQHNNLSQFALQHINILREKNGKQKIKLNPLLTEIARRHSEDMAKNIKEMSHDGFKKEKAHERIKEGKVPNANTNELEYIPYPINIAWSGENVGKRNINNSYKIKVKTEESTSQKEKQAMEALVDQHVFFMDEPEDEANHRTTMLSILYPFTEVGIGLYLDEEGNLWITEDYISIQE